MKRNAVIIIMLAAAIVSAAAAVAGCTGGSTGSNALSPTPAPAKTATDVLEKFDALKEKINASGLSFGGVVSGEDTAMVYIYKPVGGGDTTDVIAKGFDALYSVFTTDDSLYVGLVDTAQKISSQQYKVDFYSLDRPDVELYVDGNITKSEMVSKAKIVTSDSVGTNNTTPTALSSSLPARPGNYAAPADRQAYTTEYLNKTGYKLSNLQAGTTSDGQKVVKLDILMPERLSNAGIYKEIEAGLAACAGAFGDCDRYYLTLGSGKGDEYYIVSADSLPAVDYTDGLISQYELYNNVNMMYIIAQ